MKYSTAQFSKTLLQQQGPTKLLLCESPSDSGYKVSGSERGHEWTLQLNVSKLTSVSCIIPTLIVLTGQLLPQTKGV